MTATDPRDDALLERFRRIRAWAQRGERAPHKPLLLLMLLARVQAGRPASVSFAEIEPVLRELLRRFGPPRRSFHPEYPFWHLQSDGLWTLSDAARDLPMKRGGSSPPLSALRAANPIGSLDPALVADLRARPDLVNRIAAELLEDGWAESYHTDILDAVDFPGPR